MAGSISFNSNYCEKQDNVTEKQITSSQQVSSNRAFGEESVPNIDRTLTKDTVNFRANVKYEEESSPMTTVLGVAGMAALAVIGLGYAKKTNAISKISNEKARNIINKAAEPCYKIYCKVESLSKNCYDKVVNFIKKK